MGDQRQQKLLLLLKTQGTLSVAELAQHFGCSAATIRRDLQALADRGEIRRFHGAAALDSDVMELRFHEKSASRRAEKAAIADLVARWIPDGAVIGMNGGTTTSAVAERLVELERQVTVVTNAINIAYGLTNGGINVVVIGGAVRPHNYETIGPKAVEALADLHLDWAILGANGVDERFGITATTEQEAAVGRRFGERADHVLVAADSSKFGHTALFGMLDWESVHYGATDAAALPTIESWGFHAVDRTDGAVLWSTRPAPPDRRLR